MKNNLLFFLVNIILFYLFIFIFLYSSNVKENILYAFDVWTNTLIPSIFPFIIISNLLINYGFIDILSLFLGRFVEFIFNLPKEATYAVIISFFTGFPTGSKYVRDLLDKGMISKEDANHLIMFTNYSNPLFVVSGIGEGMLKSKTLGIIILIMHIISGLLVGFIFKKKRKVVNYKSNKRYQESFIKVLTESINNGFRILINMLGIIIFFLIVISIIDKLLPNNIITAILKGIIEITIGINNIARMNINITLKASLIGFIISFSGISVHFQTKSIIENSQIKYKNYLIARIFHAILCFSLTYLSISLLNKFYLLQ